MSNEGISHNDDTINNRRISVVLLAGLPASGKSTLARKLKDRFSRADGAADDSHTAKKVSGDCARWRLIHIEYDDLEDSLLSVLDAERDATEANSDEVGNQRREAWNLARKNALKQLDEEIQKIISRGASDIIEAPMVSSDTVILMDDNFHLRGMRKQIHRFLLNHRPIRFGILYLKTPLETCLERNRKRSGRRNIPCEVIEKMSTSFEPPRLSWEISATKTIAHSDFSESGPGKFEEIVRFIQDCPEIVDLPCDDIDLEQQASDRAKTRENEMHGLDKLLRSYVGRVAKFDKSLARKANSARKTVMEDFKSGRIETAAVNEAFLDLLVPMDSSSGNDEDSTVRLALRKILDESTTGNA